MGSVEGRLTVFAGTEAVELGEEHVERLLDGGLAGREPAALTEDTSCQSLKLGRRRED